MHDLISRTQAIDAISSMFAPIPSQKDMVEDCLEIIENLPSAQPEIIRCKDCKYIRKWRSEESAKKFGQIYECGRGVFDCHKPEDFCSHAERKEE